MHTYASLCALAAQWRSEIWYIALSLTAKLFLGGFLYSNVLRMSSVAESLDASN